MTASEVGDVLKHWEALVTPRLRGVIHTWAFVASLGTGGFVFALALFSTWQAVLAAAIYAVAMSLLFGTSALYHRGHWSRGAKRWMRRADHSMIFVLIAGTYTPFALLSLPGAWGISVLAVVWAGALAGIVLTVAWVDAPRWLTVAAYLSTGWVAIVAMPVIFTHVDHVAFALLVGGGLVYSLGAVCYALRRPDPSPHVFGYHEVFHLCTVVAAAAHYGAIAGFVVPSAA